MKIRSLATLSAALVLTACANDSADSNASNIVSIPGSADGHFGARGLLGRDHRTQFDTTTSTVFDTSDPAPGEIDALDLTVLNADGSTNFTRAFDRVSAPQYSFALDGLARGTAFRVNARVAGLPGEPFQQVTVNSTVRLRPDIIVGPDRPGHSGIVGPDRSRFGGIVGPDIVGPDHIRIGMAMSIVALFREVNGDVGASTKCQLSVDGVQVLDAVSLEVPAGGAVTCSFSYAFPTLGVHQISVSAVDVAPIDYDTSNNVFTFPVTIVGPDRMRVNFPGHGRGHGNGNGNGNGNGRP